MNQKTRIGRGRVSRATTVAAALILIIPFHFANAWSFDAKTMITNWVKSSTLLADLHREHVSSPQVRHMMKSTPLVDAPDDAKMEFANGPFGKMVAAAMESEQMMLGDWKIEKIVEAAGEGFDEAEAHGRLVDVLDRSPPVVLFSFVDCPWCLLAEKLLKAEYRLPEGDGGILRVVALEELGREGKELRAAVALATGRTSMPACFVDKLSVGGYTDGFSSADRGPDDAAGDSGFKYVPSPERDLRLIGSPGLEKLHKRGELATLLRGLQ